MHRTKTFTLVLAIIATAALAQEESPMFSSIHDKFNKGQKCYIALGTLKEYVQSSPAAQRIIVPIVEGFAATKELFKLGSKIEEQKEFLAEKYQALFNNSVFKALFSNILDKCNGINTSLINFIQQEAQNEADQLQAIEAQNQENCQREGNCNLKLSFLGAKDIVKQVLRTSVMPAYCLGVGVALPPYMVIQRLLSISPSKQSFIDIVDGLLTDAIQYPVYLLGPAFMYTCFMVQLDQIKNEFKNLDIDRQSQPVEDF